MFSSNIRPKVSQISLVAIIGCLALLTVFAEQLPVKTYTIADGLARDFIYKIKQDSRGFIWFCTAEGISRFDGYDFTNYGVSDGLPHRVVTDVLIKKDGTYLFGTEAGLVYFDPAIVDSSSSHFTPIPLGNADEEPSVRSIVEDSDGSAWLATSQGLVHLTGSPGSWHAESPFRDSGTNGPSLDAVSLLLDKDGSLWIGTERNGAFKYRPDGPLEHYREENGLAQNGISCIFQDRDGTILDRNRPMFDPYCGFSQTEHEYFGQKLHN